MKTTWKELERLELVGEHVYRICDAVGNVAYVGCSKNVAKRLAEHAAGLSPVGKYLARYLPESLEWEIEIVAGEKSLEREQIELCNPPFNKVLRKSTERKQNIVLSPPDDPEWKDKLRQEFVDAAVDDYLGYAVFPHALGRLLATSLHRDRKHWHELFYPEWSLEDRFAAIMGNAIAGGDAWAMDVGHAMYTATLAALETRLSQVRAFFRTVPMPEPDNFGKLPRIERETINALDVAIEMQTLPPEFAADMLRNIPGAVKGRRGFPLPMVNPSAEGWIKY